MAEVSTLRQKMVKNQLAARGISDPRILDAMRRVPRDAFVSPDLVEYAYEDSPLPIGEEQTISQPFMVALMIDALGLSEEDRVLEIGTGSGYAAAVLAEIAKEVYTVERHASLAEGARKRLEDMGYDNVRVLHGDGTLGWDDHAPYDAIVVAAGGPDIPDPLKDQLAIGGTLVIPTGSSPRQQKLVRVHRISEEEYLREDLGQVRFVPLVGKAGWEDESASTIELKTAAPLVESLPEQIVKNVEAFTSIPESKLDGLLRRIGNARVVLLGESTHGTSEFYRMRAHITQHLVEEKGFNIVAVEADWPDASRVNDFIHSKPYQAGKYQPFSRFPTWMWANTDVVDFANWLREHNQGQSSEVERVGFYGLDLYSMYSSIDAVLEYLDGVDEEAARIARQRYGCLTPWEQDPASYGQATISGKYRECEEEVISILGDLMSKRITLAEKNGHSVL
jgi:protein-L-isoaspartate(D-aspartate) O-methyltransferase